MNLALLTHVRINITWASLHQWRPGDSLEQVGVGGYPLWLGLGGTVVVRCEGHEWHLTEGTVLLLPQHTQREILTPDGARWLSLGLTARLFGQIDVLDSLAPPILWTPPVIERQALDRWMRQIIAEWQDTAMRPTMVRGTPGRALPMRRPRDPLAALVSDGLAQAVFGYCWRTLAGTDNTTTPSRSEAPPWLTQALERVLREPQVTVHDLTVASGLSPAQFRRLFHQWVGVSPQLYLTDRRLDAARELLVTTELPVTQVAERVGLESVSYFTRLFTRTVGVSPGRYRQRMHEPGV